MKRSPSLRTQRARQQARLGQHLEAVADAEHRAAVGGEALDRVHHRREAGDRPGPQVVTVGEAPGNDDGVDAVERSARRARRCSAVAPSADERLDDVVLAVRAREDDDRRSAASRRAGSAGRLDVATSARSMTGLASSRSHISLDASPRRRPRRRPRARSGSTLPTWTLAHAGEAERRERPLDRLALGIGDPLEAADLDATAKFTRRHFATPHQSEKRQPGDPLVGGDVALTRRRDDLGAGSAAAPTPCPSRCAPPSRAPAACRTTAATSPAPRRPPARTATESGVRISSQIASSPSIDAELELRVGDDDPALERPLGAARRRPRAQISRAASASSAPTSVARLLEGDVLVVALGRLRRGREDRLGEPVGLAQSLRAAARRASSPTPGTPSTPSR